jgi:nucleoside-diphosphate-sugar epimerase
MTVLVTGASGFLGGHLVDLLAARGDRVRILVRPGEDTTRLARTDVEICSGDLVDRSSLEAAVDGIDRVLHCAARTGPWGDVAQYNKINVWGVQTLLETAMAAGVERFVHVSSVTVHGTDIQGCADETMPLRGGSDPYSKTKERAERLLQWMITRRGAPVTIVRPGLIYGPGDHNSFARFARLIEQRRLPIVGSGHNHLPLIYVTDVARGVLLAAEAARAIGRTYLLVNDEPVTQLDYFGAIAGELGVAPPHRHVPYRVALSLGATAEAAGHLVRLQRPPPATRFGMRQIGGENRFLIGRARNELGFSPNVELAKGVRESITWYRKQRDHRGAPAPWK